MIFCGSNASLRCWQELLWVVALYLSALGVTGCLGQLYSATLTIRIALLSREVYSGHMSWPHTDDIRYSAVLCTTAVVVILDVSYPGTVRTERNAHIFSMTVFHRSVFSYKCTRKTSFTPVNCVFRNDGGTNIVGYPRHVVKPYDCCAARIPPQHGSETVHGSTYRRRTIIKFLTIHTLSRVTQTVF